MPSDIQATFSMRTPETLIPKLVIAPAFVLGFAFIYGFMIWNGLLSMIPRPPAWLNRYALAPAS